MKRIIWICSLLLLMGGCDRPKRISDKELTAIVKDIYLTNAYWEIELVGNSLEFDSIDIYEPIFANYGVTSDDFLSAINSLNQRKSFRLTDLISRSLSELEAEGAYYEERVRVLDTLEVIAAKQTTRILYRDTIPRHITTFAEDEKGEADIRLSLRPGRYEVGYRYHLDSNHRASLLRYIHHQVDSQDRKVLRVTRTYRRDDDPVREEMSFYVMDSAMHYLDIFLSRRTRSIENNEVSLWIDSIEVRYTPHVAETLDSLDRRVARANFYTARWADSVRRWREELSAPLPVQDTLTVQDTPLMMDSLPHLVDPFYLYDTIPVQLREIRPFLDYDSIHEPEPFLLRFSPLGMDSTGVDSTSTASLR